MADEEKAVKPPLIREEVIPESLRLHSTIPTQTAAKMAKYQKFQPRAISFDIFNGDQKYMDISSAFMHIECQIRNGKSETIPLKGDPPESGGPVPFHPLGKVLPVKSMGYTLFTNVKVALNNVVIDLGSVLYLIEETLRPGFSIAKMSKRDHCSSWDSVKRSCHSRM